MYLCLFFMDSKTSKPIFPKFCTYIKYIFILAEVTSVDYVRSTFKLFTTFIKNNFHILWTISIKFYIWLKLHIRDNIGCIEFYPRPPSNIKWTVSPTIKTYLLHLWADFPKFYTWMKLQKSGNRGYMELYFGPTSTIKWAFSSTTQIQFLHLLTDFRQILYRDSVL